MAPREWYPIWGPYPNSVGGGPHKYKVYTLSPHYEKRYPPLPKVPLFAVEIETHPLGEGYKLTCPTP